MLGCSHLESILYNKRCQVLRTLNADPERMPLRRSGPEGESSDVARTAEQASISAAGIPMLANGASNINWSVSIFLRMMRGGR